MKNTYSYPPSENILKYGEIVKDSHFYCEGFLFLEQGKKIRCNFEVAYTQAGNVNVVCYVESKYDELMNTFNRRASHYDFPIKLVGRGLRDELNVIVESLSLRTISVAFGGTKFNLIQYVANCFRAYISDKDLNKVPSDKYTIGLPHYEISGINFPRWFTLNYDKKPNEVREYEFKIRDEYSITLYFGIYADDKEYENQPTGGLYIDFENLPKDLKLNDVASYWCCLCSLAIGKDIHWTVFKTTVIGWTVPYLEKTWQRQYMHDDMKFLPIITNQLGSSKDWELLSKFINVGFNALLSDRITVSELNNINMMIRQYVNYRLINVMTTNGEMRLLTTLTEEFLYTWERTKNVSSPNIITRSERKKLTSIVKATLEEKREDIFQDNLSNFEEIKTKVVGELNKNIRKKTLYERLKYFFQFYKSELLTPDKLDNRIKSFVDTRNSIAHDGEFAHLNEKYSSRNLVQFNFDENKYVHASHEIANVRMMLPLMVMAMIGYTGEFEDLLGKTWR